MDPHNKINKMPSHLMFLATICIFGYMVLICWHKYDQPFHGREDILPKSLANCIIILYRSDCPECAAIHEEITGSLSSRNDVYFISSRGAQGENLRKDYPIASVPAAIYFESDGKTRHVAYLAKTDESGTVFLEDNLERLKSLQDLKR